MIIIIKPILGEPVFIVFGQDRSNSPFIKLDLCSHMDPEDFHLHHLHSSTPERNRK